MQLFTPDFSSARVLVVGDLMLDRYWHGQTGRISPEAPVPVVHIKDHEGRPGGAGNVALNIVALGGNATLLSLVGKDEAADSLRLQLNEAGVQCEFEEVEGSDTITKLRVMSRNQQLIRLDFEDGFEDYDHAHLLSRFDHCLRDCDTVVFSDYGKGCLDEIRAMISRARAAGKQVLVDPKGTDFSRYTGATLITPNESEFAAVVGWWHDDSELVERAHSLRTACELDALLVTRSERGMALIQSDQELHIPTLAQEVYDVTGAGDTVIGTLAASLAAGETIEDATRLANLAAGIVVAKLGTATLSAEELNRAVLGEAVEETGILSVHALQKQIQTARARGEKVVMTNGCFDILHAGHVQYLEQARSLGDKLIVAVNSDDSVERLKGPERPINPLEQRMAVLSGLGSVDWVVPFGKDSVDDTPAELIKELLPDILVKGGDYKAEDVAGGEAVIRNGGEVIILGFLDGCSTTNIVRRIRTTEENQGS
ncbi:bifunctional D-glycero-beta-D-manno-heptose-7-phosphate kinase/D-glycero-beta-D-manno-heptose 1-phosphate adenylyltransferase HldE [Motiliproteus coralliicola]|uniref:Bifunctional protein HldE n=1 Tax=Motiliproteus coralliicola TaxID=2283196 RepID=A0A369WAR1_9GAMM|nr:bifunctional D-glycero-beta-D-manno-heptose-7-phosphate kinase/D-glycero-beta-D-manno-heptose 1-phosphate adenylyltransferase HldE [Motiliproteus coralliicola]RDE18747.1 bifunctional D-glycero-beta-D-manno-heptose-7-phosphate kinase/D-glycero-beta-D-manno-heptose 1-phosphate adenylyltransferase HldE [Motiliproteus coralliicola]